ncbi:XkdX family protein [Clostridium butyricum]|nr:XkdX family protein [Clostridium butyricum]
MYNLIKEYYKLNLFNDNSIELFAKVGWISEEQKVEIINSKATS